MGRRRLPYETLRRNMHLRKDLVEFFEGTVLLRAEEQRIGYGFNDIVNECLEEKMRKMLESQGGA